MRQQLLTVALLALLGVASAKPALFETFSEGWESRWQHSEDDKYAGKFKVDVPTEWADEALKVTEKAKHYGISGLLDKAFDPSEGLALQYEVLVTEGMSCGGAYMKFLTADKEFTPAGLKDDTPYTVMFGPDKCGATNKVHLIFRHKNPVTGNIEEKHLQSPPALPSDAKTHVYTAVIRPDNTYTVYIDGVDKKSGSLLEDFEPSFLPPKEIPDPEDSKPEDWVDTAKIPDPDAVKPDDWDEDAPRTIPDEDAEMPADWLPDEPAQIDDPDASMPEDWDEDEDGEWEAPQLPNPKCAKAAGCGEWQRPTKPNPAFKGKWSAPMIDNPAYKGPWKPRDIPNPEFHEDKEPLKHIGAIGAAAVEIWTMDSGIFFDNIVVASDYETVKEIMDSHWKPKADEEAKALLEKSKKEREAREAEEAAKKQSAGDPAVKALHSLINSVPFLAANKDKMAPALEIVEKTPAILYAAIAVPAVLLLLLVVRSLTRSKATAPVPDAVGAAKKADQTGADDVAPANGARAAAAAENNEIEEEEEGSEEEDAGVRRRTRREN